ncbi:alpha-ketoglutarate-dependent dioxygenase AlkB family protein [Bosea sp. NBC_00550]|jgi:alkylated DNA repair protein (DNA oxidative demethylase)|uniref:alpha-ketoglutarate-dependent dioxygenase AlkB family protein n=1 Tax=Bosea sp. NBC_00550 TaxID=2969621 RepID=UPI002230AF62|nr:alpha-ketoglutarate-dependent dioxygenase AlkB [Bosea sp. NBC_00550]UZF92217.1 alpha-ketoglutarate-dependent dioxygenase AlkB [Bosea sp. NBC_00550]
MTRVAVAPGVFHWPGRLAPVEQAALLAELRAVARKAPFFQPRMPKTGKPFSVRMTNCGTLGWVSDERGYRYQPLHPETGEPWPLMPAPLLDLWNELSGYPHPPEACLVNFYAGGAKMGLHQDRDEQEFDAPVLSVSLGDAAIFRIGGTARGGKTASLKLASGDVLLFGGEARLAYHGIDRILAGSSTLLPEGGRINLTLRRVTKP